jgi:peroxiredoxin Q/BCP
MDFTMTAFFIDVMYWCVKVDNNCLVRLCTEEYSMSLEGTKAADFSLEGSDGASHTLAEFSGKTVVIFFYPKDNTPGCTKEACGFRDGYQQLAGRDIVILGVSKDSIASHGKFITAYNLPFTLLSDPDTSMMAAYGAFGEKVMYGKKTTGTIRSTVVIGADGIIKKHWTKVAKAEQHPAQVFDYLAAL